MSGFVKGQSGNPAGRPKGTLNKTTQAAKDVIAKAAEDLGGADRLLAWCKEAPENEKVFWGTIYPKLLPFTVAGDPDSPLEIVGKFKLAPLD